MNVSNAHQQEQDLIVIGRFNIYIKEESSWEKIKAECEWFKYTRVSDINQLLWYLQSSSFWMSCEFSPKYKTTEFCADESKYKVSNIEFDLLTPGDNLILGL